MKSLGLFGTVAEEAVPVLRRILHDRSQPHERRIVAADALGQIATPAAIGALSEELLRPAGSESYKQSLLRQVMIDGLWLAGPQAAGALLALSRATEDPNAEVRRKACRAIGAIGPQAAGVVSVLFDRLILDDVPAVKDAAAEAMSQVGPSAVPLLVRVLEGGDANLQWQAAQALGNTGEYADPAIPSLRRALHADDSRVRLQAADALLRVAGDRSGVRKEVAATALEEITAAGRQQRRHAAELLISMNPLPSSTRQPLTRLAGNPSSPGSRTAAYIFRERKRRQNPSAGR